MFEVLAATALISTLSIHEDLNVLLARWDGRVAESSHLFDWTFEARGHVDTDARLFSLDSLEYTVPIGSFTQDIFTFTWGDWELDGAQALTLRSDDAAFMAFDPIIAGTLARTGSPTVDVVVRPDLEVDCHLSQGECDTYFHLGLYASPYQTDLIIGPSGDLADTLPKTPEPSALALLLAGTIAALCRRGASQ